MSSIEATVLDCINVQVDGAGNLVGYINKERMIDFLRTARVNNDGCIKFTSEKRRSPHKLYSHMPPLMIKWGNYETSSLPIPEHDLSSPSSHFTTPLNGYKHPEDERF